MCTTSSSRTDATRLPAATEGTPGTWTDRLVSRAGGGAPLSQLCGEGTRETHSSETGHSQSQRSRGRSQKNGSNSPCGGDLAFGFGLVSPRQRVNKIPKFGRKLHSNSVRFKTASVDLKGRARSSGSPRDRFKTLGRQIVGGQIAQRCDIGNDLRNDNAVEAM